MTHGTLGESQKCQEAPIYMLLGQHAVTPYRDHKIFRLIFGSLLFLMTFGGKVVALETPCCLPGTLT